MQSSKPLLLIEDDPVDACAVQRAFQACAIVTDLCHVSCGDQALDYLQGDTEARPCLILLDLTLPDISGLDLLRRIKGDPSLCHIPVVVLTASTDRADIDQVFYEGGVGYMVKPSGSESYQPLVDAISRYWAMSAPPVLSDG